MLFCSSSVSLSMRRSGNVSATNKDRFLFAYSQMVGQKVTLKLKGQAEYEGVLHTISERDQTVVLRHARELPVSGKTSGPLVDEMMFPGAQILSVTAMEADQSKFRTDEETSRGGPGERSLQAWSGEEGALSGVALERGKSGSTSWDQFAVNEQLFQVKSTYQEELYTTPLDKRRLTPEQRQHAERIAQQIESGRSHGGRDQELDGEQDEEAAFSAVVGTGAYSKQSKNEKISPPVVPLPPTSNSAYVPPNQRANVPAGSAWGKGPGLAAVPPPNAGLNALNLEPANAARKSEVPIPLTEQNLQFHTQQTQKPPVVVPASPPAGSEMKSINALNLEPAAVKADGRQARGTIGGRPLQPEEQKREFQKDLEEIKAKTLARSNKGSSPSPSPALLTAIQSASSAPPPPPSNSRFSFNPKASTFTPGVSAAPANSSTLNIAITPGGSLSGTLKGSSYGVVEAEVMPPQAMQPMMPMIVMPQYPPCPAFAPFCEGSALERISMAECTRNYVETGSCHLAGSWCMDQSAGSYRAILGNFENVHQQMVGFISQPGGPMMMPMQFAGQFQMPFQHPQFFPGQRMPAGGIVFNPGSRPYEEGPPRSGYRNRYPEQHQ